MRVVVLGTGGHGRETLEVIEEMTRAGESLEAIGFLDDMSPLTGSSVSGYPVLGTREWLIGRQAEVALAIGVGASAARCRLAQWAIENGIHTPPLVHPSCQLSSRASVGRGVVLLAGTRISTDVTLEDFVHVNVECSISHDCCIERYATLGPAVHLAGGVTVQEGAELGIGVVARPRASVGRWTVIGAGAVIVSDIPANSVAMGVPARVIRARENGWLQSR